jgi:NADH:ubiquinone oxidoreductase subunit E
MKPFCSVEKTIVKNGKKVVVCDETRDNLIPVLQKTQDKKGYISDKDMQKIADDFNIHPVEVYSVATFYSFLLTEKKGKNIIRISNCISSVMKNNQSIIKAFEKELNIKLGETTKDNKISLELTSCIGMCDESPAILVNDKLIGKVTPKKVKQIVKELK